MKSTFILPNLILLPLLAACTFNASDYGAVPSAPNYPPPPPQRIYETPAQGSAAITNHDLASSATQLKGSLANLFEAVRPYGPNSYQRLRADMRDLDARVDILQSAIAQNQPYPQIRSAFSDVQTSAVSADQLMHSISAHPPVQASWNQFIGTLRQAETVFR